MDELKNQLKQADDAYLAGLSNKGTVKRAHKDLEQETPEVLWDESGNEVQVTFKEAACRIRAPLGSSTCSCPSRSICRHVTAAILWVRGILEKEETAGSEAAEPAPGPASSRAFEAAPGTASSRADVQAPGTASFEAVLEQEADPAPAPSAALEEALLAVPLDRLKRACRNKAYREFAARAEAGELPSLSMGSVITVRFPWAEQVVKLLYPLEYSSCTCRSRELCSHKAQAILAFQIRRKAITAEMLKAREEDAGSWDQEAVLRAARSIKEGIRLQLFTGLSRLSPEAAQSMERLAVISHGAGLASFETGFRSAAAEYEQYFSRSASFCGERLLARLLSLYDRACSLEKTRDRDTFQRLAGTFRDTYEPVPRLQLTAVGSRHVKSKAGYEGEKYYFLETGQHRWYTWMDVRPTFYEGVRRRPAGRDGGQLAPWGLNCSREKMMELEFALTQAKAAQDGRLSVSRETKSEILGTRRLDRPEIREMVFWDYRALLRDLEQKEQRADQMSGPEEKSGESLALVGAARIREGTFDTIRQRFSMELFDPAGRRIQAEVNYSKEEKLTIQVLERLAKRLGEPRDAGEGNVAEEIPKGEISQGETSRERNPGLIFFGILYLEDGRLCLYPIEYFECIQGDMPKGRDEGLAGEKNEGQSKEKGTAQIAGNSAEDGAVGKVSSATVKTLERFLDEMEETLADLFRSGLLSPQEELLAGLSRLGQESRAMGLSRAGKELARLEAILEKERHQLKPNPEPAIGPWMELMEYVRLGKQRTAFDLAHLELYAEQESLLREGESGRTTI